MKIAVIGATGLVGDKILRVLEERNVAISEFIPVASERSVGRKVEFNNTEYDVISIEDALNRGPDISIFSNVSIMTDSNVRIYQVTLFSYPCRSIMGYPTN